MLAALASLWAGSYLRKEVLRPIRAVSQEAARFARETCRTEDDPAELRRVYELGRKEMEERLPELREFLEKSC